MKRGHTATVDGPEAPRRKRLVLRCSHPRVERGSCLDVCLDCGAVAAPGQTTFYSEEER